MEKVNFWYSYVLKLKLINIVKHGFVLMCSIQIDTRREQLLLAKTELKQVKKEAKTKGSTDTKLQTYVFLY